MATAIKVKKAKRKKSDQVQEIIFKVVLTGTDPVVTRRLKLSSDMTLDNLSYAIRGAFEWMGAHGHIFNFGKGRKCSGCDFGDEDDRMEFPAPEESADIYLSEFLNPKHKPFKYEYDFGDSWLLIVSIESVKPMERSIKLPECIAGENSAPPEDCGGTPGFENFKKIMANKRDPEHTSMKDWYGGDFYPQKFDIVEANKMIHEFLGTAPQKRLREFLSETI